MNYRSDVIIKSVISLPTCNTHKISKIDKRNSIGKRKCCLGPFADCLNMERRFILRPITPATVYVK